MVKPCRGISWGDSPDIPCMLGSFWADHSWNGAAGPIGLLRGMSDRTIPPGMKKTAMMFAAGVANRTDEAKKTDEAVGGNGRFGK